MTDEKAFQATIEANPLAAGPRLVHADYLEDTGDTSAENERNVGELLARRSYAVPVQGKVKAIAQAVGYRGREADIQPALQVELSGTYWDGGSRYTYTAVTLGGTVTVDYPHYNPPQFGGPVTDVIVPLASSIVIVRTGTIAGTDAGMTIFGLPDTVAQLATVETVYLSREEKIVLAATRGLKSSYAGQSNYRFHEAKRRTGIDLATWEATKTDCVTKGYLNKAGAITTTGRNAIGRTDLFDLR